MTLPRRTLLATALALPAFHPAASADVKKIRIGFQKGEPVEMAAKANNDLEALFGPRGIAIEWIEFQFGPPMLEAMRLGAIDIGAAGDTPPVFAQVAHGDILYIAANRGAPQSVLLPPDSPIKTLADLKGKKLAFGRGSSAHHFALLVLEKAGLRYDQVEPIYLGPADAGAAFERGAIDAWSIWEPYTSLFTSRPGVRVLTTNAEIGEQYSFFLGNGAFVRANPALTTELINAFAATAVRARGDRAKVAAVLAEGTGNHADVWSRALAKDPFEVLPMNEALTQSQQRVADRFRALGLVPVDIKVADIVWRAGV